MIRTSILSATLVLLSATTTLGGVILLDSQMTFDLLNRPPVELISFGNTTGSQIPGDSFSDATTFFSPNASDPSKVRVFENSFGFNVADSSGLSLRVTFDETIDAVTFLTTNASSLANINVFDRVGQLIGQLQTTTPNGYVAIVSDDPIGSFVFTSGVGHPGDRIGLTEFSTYAMPEPSPIFVLVLGVLLFRVSR